MSTSWEFQALFFFFLLVFYKDGLAYLERDTRLASRTATRQCKRTGKADIGRISVAWDSINGWLQSGKRGRSAFTTEKPTCSTALCTRHLKHRCVMLYHHPSPYTALIIVIYVHKCSLALDNSKTATSLSLPIVHFTYRKVWVVDETAQIWWTTWVKRRRTGCDCGDGQKQGDNDVHSRTGHLGWGRIACYFSYTHTHTHIHIYISQR